MRNVVELIGALLLPTLLGLGALGGARALRLLRTRRAVVAPALPPLEQVAGDLRRLRAQLMAFEAQPPGPGRRIRLRALQAAYAETLTVACQALDVSPPRRPDGGRAPAAEVYRAEAALRVRGLDVRQPAIR